MKEWLWIAWSASVRRRATRVSLIVGSVLIAINHGDALLLRGDIDRVRLFRMALTVAVPYLVSTLSSVGAIRELRRPRALSETDADEEHRWRSA
ncbi:MAG TPA: nitrate/nitrite transporter NrtS [Thermoanaerobaculia bacterium]|nr:nitrate/nitrite transporter NrtS [Thermoanaerobaculia bacterium]